MTPLTTDELEAAIAGGDTVRICGYRKSQHHEAHPALDLRTKRCGAGGFRESHFHTRMADPDGMFEGRKRRRK